LVWVAGQHVLPRELVPKLLGGQTGSLLEGNQKLYTLVPANSGAFGYADFEYFRFSAGRD
jgi:hypothetical protein